MFARLSTYLVGLSKMGTGVMAGGGLGMGPSAEIHNYYRWKNKLKTYKRKKRLKKLKELKEKLK